MVIVDKSTKIYKVTKKSLPIDTQFRTLGLVLVVAILAGGLFFVSRRYFVHSPNINYSAQSQSNSQKTIMGVANGGVIKFRSDKLGIEFQIPNIKDFSVLTEKFGDNTQNYCLSAGSVGSGICSANLFAVSSFTKGSAQKRGFEFSDLTSFTKTNTGYVVHETFSDGTSSEVTIGNAKYLNNKNGIQILKVLGKSEYSKMQQQYISVFGHPGEGYIGAIVNLPDNPEYSGFNITMKLSDTLTEKVFDQILESIKITK